MPNDRRVESSHFKSFRRLAQAGGLHVPDGQVTHAGTNGETAPDGAPDFLIRAAGRTIGIEHREMLKPYAETGVPERAIEQYTDEILAMGQELAELRGMPCARVSIIFGQTVPTDRGGRLALARALEQLVSEYMPADRENVHLDYEDLWKRGFGDAVATVFIHRYDSLPHSGIWVAPRAGFVWPDPRPLLQEAIDEKAERLRDYLRHCDECWLLLVADSAKPSASMHLDDEVAAQGLISPFARTLFLDYGLGRLHQLKTQSP